MRSKAQKIMRDKLQDVSLVLMMGSITHSIAVSNMLPASVRIVMVDINPSAVSKLTDQQSFQSIGLVTDVEPFLRELVEDIAAQEKLVGHWLEVRTLCEIIRMRDLLLCPPDHYGIEYEINPWMSRARGADTPKVQAQWKGLHETLSKLDTRVHLIPPKAKTAGHGLHGERRPGCRTSLYPE